MICAGARRLLRAASDRDRARNVRLRVFIGTQASGADIFGRFDPVDLHAHLVHVGAERTLRMSVGVADIAAADFAFAANGAYFTHDNTSTG